MKKHTNKSSVPNVRKRIRTAQFVVVGVVLFLVLAYVWGTTVVTERTFSVNYRACPTKLEGYRVVQLPLTQVWIYLFEVSNPVPLRWQDLERRRAKINLVINFNTTTPGGNARAVCNLAQATGSAAVDRRVQQWCTEVSNQLEYKSVGLGVWKLRITLDGVTRHASVEYLDCGNGLRPPSGCVRFCASDQPQYNIDVFPFPVPRRVSNVKFRQTGVCKACQ
ncbi:MAG TPA: hypothetical protein ENK07_09550 [Bacteroidetes bacterium]|nr:hypothetical protein [Bacteroidota bacterium]